MNMQPTPDTNYLINVFLPIGLVVAGGAIGFGASWFLARSQRRHDLEQKAADERRSYKAWLTGLRAELNHIRKVIDEITPIAAGVNLPTKRINSDFLKEARLVIFKYDEDTDFLELLTTAFRDIVHTNDMLDRLEEETAASRQNIRPNVITSMEGVSGSVKDLSDALDKKLKSLQDS